MGTRRLLSGSEDVWPGDGSADRSSSFHYSSSISVGSLFLSGASTTAYCPIWTPPLKPLVLLGARLLVGSIGSNCPSADTVGTLDISFGLGGYSGSPTTLNVPLAFYAIPSTDWALSGGFYAYPASSSTPTTLFNGYGRGGGVSSNPATKDFMGTLQVGGVFCDFTSGTDQTQFALTAQFSGGTVFLSASAFTITAQLFGFWL